MTDSIGTVSLSDETVDRLAAAIAKAINGEATTVVQNIYGNFPEAQVAAIAAAQTAAIRAARKLAAKAP